MLGTQYATLVVLFYWKMIVCFLFVLLLYVPSQQLSSLRDSLREDDCVGTVQYHGT